MKKGVLLFALTVLVIVLSSFAAAFAQETEQEHLFN